MKILYTQKNSKDYYFYFYFLKISFILPLCFPRHFHIPYNHHGVLIRLVGNLEELKEQVLD